MKDLKLADMFAGSEILVNNGKTIAEYTVLHGALIKSEVCLRPDPETPVESVSIDGTTKHIINLNK